MSHQGTANPDGEGNFVLVDLPAPYEPVIIDMDKTLESQFPKGPFLTTLRAFVEQMKLKPKLEMRLLPITPTANMRKAGYIRLTTLGPNVRVAEIWESMVNAWEEERKANEQQPTGTR